MKKYFNFNRFSLGFGTGSSYRMQMVRVAITILFQKKTVVQSRQWELEIFRETWFYKK